MKTDVRIRGKGFAVRHLKALPVLLGLLGAGAGSVAHAQSDGGMTAATPTRAQVKMERDEFLQSHRWDAVTENWVLRPDFEAPTGMKSRLEVRAGRDEFLRSNRWDEVAGNWVSLRGQPRNLSTMSREQLRAETREFVRTHVWDELAGSWVEQKQITTASKRK